MSGITDENLGYLKARHRTAMVVIGAEVAVVLALVALSFKPLSLFTKTADEQTRMSLWMAVLFFAAGSLLLRRLLNNWDRLSNVAILGGIPGLLTKLLINSAVTSSFGVLAAVVGFIISQMTGDPLDMVRAAAVSFVVFFANFPKRSVWRAVVARLQES